MERRGLAVFWYGAILFGCVLLREAGEFQSVTDFLQKKKKSEAANTTLKSTRVAL